MINLHPARMGSGSGYWAVRRVITAVRHEEGGKEGLVGGRKKRGGGEDGPQAVLTTWDMELWTYCSVSQLCASESSIPISVDLSRKDNLPKQREEERTL
jgi:hypothetical protein